MCAIFLFISGVVVLLLDSGVEAHFFASGKENSMFSVLFYILLVFFNFIGPR